MPKKNNQSFSQMYLADVLKGEVQSWVEQGWHGVTQTTLELFHYWFQRDEEATERFHPCQQRAIETLIYCYEILQGKTLQEVFERVAPEALTQHLPLQKEVESIPFPKYALKMATGSGKTWVLAALLVWQYFNKINDEAHHVHGKRSATGAELIRRQFMNILHNRLKENHKNDIGMFLQIDFSATPFYGSAEKREFFPHIIYE